MREKIEAEVKTLEAEFNKLKDVAIRLEKQRKDIHEQLLQIQGAHSKLNQLLGTPPVVESIATEVIEEAKADTADASTPTAA